MFALYFSYVLIFWAYCVRVAGFSWGYLVMIIIDCVFMLMSEYVDLRILYSRH